MEIPSRFVAPQRMGAWLIVTLGTALAALVISVWGIMESRAVDAALQVELLKFHERIKKMEAAKPAPAPAEAMPLAAPAEMPK